MTTPNTSNYPDRRYSGAASAKRDFLHALRRYSSLVINPPATGSQHINAARLQAAWELAKATMRRTDAGYNRMAIAHDMTVMQRSAPHIMPFAFDRLDAERIAIDAMHWQRGAA